MFATFIIDMDNLQMVHLMLTAPGINIQRFFESITEPPDRSAQFLHYVRYKRFHHSIFSLTKLFNNAELAHALFLSAQYDGNLLINHPPAIFRFLLRDPNIQQVVLLTVLRQIKQMENLEFFESLCQYGNTRLVAWMFEALHEQMDLTPMIMRALKSPPMVSLMTNYLTDHVPLVERRFRVANTLLAIHDGIFESRPLLERVWSKVENVFGIGIRDNLDFEASRSLFYALLESIVGFENCHSWGVVAALLLHAQTLNDGGSGWTLECTKWLLYRTSNPSLLPPYLTRSLLQRLSITPAEVSYLSGKYLPLYLLPLEERRLLWLRNGPLRVFSSNRLSHGSSWQRCLILQIVNCIDVPTNICYYSFTRPPLPLNDVIFTFAKLSESLTEAVRRDILVGVVPYLLADSRQLNLVLFEGQPAGEEWEQFYSRVATIIGSSPNYLRGRFGLWKIEKYFSPIDLKSLIYTASLQDSNLSVDSEIRSEITRSNL
ncbi:hypothetical protein PSACC_00745 [Paramicrosporidium saccamoebae]|uniref:Uncharacterized protein n=1 Tax=Paramicrosporidium saccamoebae TaxID=1246581 RepID=A0A2H9TNY7_9FUNG|nr:hypothetical protein PSACC_00745 [Paramicrosporidium saccamoebae]